MIVAMELCIKCVLACFQAIFGLKTGSRVKITFKMVLMSRMTVKACLWSGRGCQCWAWACKTSIEAWVAFLFIFLLISMMWQSEKSIYSLKVNKLLKFDLRRKNNLLHEIKIVNSISYPKSCVSRILSKLCWKIEKLIFWPFM